MRGRWWETTEQIQCETEMAFKNKTTGFPDSEQEAARGHVSGKRNLQQPLSGAGRFLGAGSRVWDAA